jgi:hypothetical protein
LPSNPKKETAPRKRPRKSDEKLAYLTEDEGHLLFIIRKCELEHGRKGEPRAATPAEVLDGMNGRHSNPKVEKHNVQKIRDMVSDLRGRKKSRRYLDERNLAIAQPNRKQPVEGYRTWKPVPGYYLDLKDTVLSQPSSALFLDEMNTFKKLDDGSARVDAKKFKDYFCQKYGVTPEYIENDIRFLLRFGYMLPYGDPPHDALFYSVHDRYDEERPYIKRMADYAKEFMKPNG